MTIWLRNRKERVLNSPQTFFQVKIFNNERFEREKKKLFSLKNRIFSANFYSSHSLLYSIFEAFPRKIQSIRMRFAKNFMQALT